MIESRRRRRERRDVELDAVAASAEARGYKIRTLRPDWVCVAKPGHVLADEPAALLRRLDLAVRDDKDAEDDNAA